MTTFPEIEIQLDCGRVVSVDTDLTEYLEFKGVEVQWATLCRSDIMAVLSCPAKWRKAGTEPDKPTRSMEFGSLFDCLLLQPNKMDQYYKLSPPTYKNGDGEVKPWTLKSPTCRKWKEERQAEGFLVCCEEDEAEARKAASDLLSSEHSQQLKRLLVDAEVQVFSIAKYTDKDTGVSVWVKCLTDIVPHEDDPEFSKSLFDLKTAKSAAPRAWTKAVFDNDYHVQAALNIDIQRAATGRDFQDFRHLIIENQPPYEPAKRFLSQEFINLGRETYLRGLKTYCRCVAEKRWPSYRDTTKLLLADGFEACEPEPYMLLS